MEDDSMEEAHGNESDISDFMAEIHDHFSNLVHESYKAPKDAMEEWQGQIEV